MAVSTVNTRMLERYKATAGAALTLAPHKHSVTIPSVIIDLNKYGGLGLFVATKGQFDRLPLETILEPWRASRENREGAIAIAMRLFNVIPHGFGGKNGYRLSLLPTRYSLKDEDSKFFISTRRRAKRSARDRRNLILARDRNQLTGRLMNVGDDDGLGVAVDPASLFGITWGGLFQNGWTVASEGRIVNCFIQRLGLHKDALVLGLVAPGVTRAWEGMKQGPAPINAVNDRELMSLLDDVLTRKKGKR